MYSKNNHDFILNSKSGTITKVVLVSTSDLFELDDKCCFKLNFFLDFKGTVKMTMSDSQRFLLDHNQIKNLEMIVVFTAQKVLYSEISSIVFHKQEMLKPILNKDMDI